MGHGDTDKIPVLRRVSSAMVWWPLLAAGLGAWATWSVLQYRVEALEARSDRQERQMVRQGDAILDVQRGVDRLQVDVGWIRSALERQSRAFPETR